eukprot:2918579-Lingulodinium_polyedra.AAC.1
MRGGNSNVEFWDERGLHVCARARAGHPLIRLSPHCARAFGAMFARTRARAKCLQTGHPRARARVRAQCVTIFGRAPGPIQPASSLGSAPL